MSEVLAGCEEVNNERLKEHWPIRYASVPKDLLERHHNAM